MWNERHYTEKEKNKTRLYTSRLTKLESEKLVPYGLVQLRLASAQPRVPANSASQAWCSLLQFRRMPSGI